MEEREIRDCVLMELARQGSRFVPVGVSVRHIHLTEKDVETLFGSGYKLQPLRPLSQPGQFASKEQVTIVGPKGSLEKVRILGPARKHTQVELAMSDAMKIGIKAPIRMSGDLEGTPGCTVQGPKGQIDLPDGVIVAARHLHMSESQAKAYGLKNNDRVSIRVTGPRSCILGDIVVRCGSTHELEVHLDTDEANAGVIANGALTELVAAAETSCGTGRQSCPCAECSRCGHAEKSEPKPPVQTAPNGGKKLLKLVTERDVNDAVQDHANEVFCEKKALITPAAVDRSAETSIKIVRM